MESPHRDEPLTSRNVPTSLNILTSSTSMEKDEVFNNSQLCIEDEIAHLNLNSPQVMTSMLKTTPTLTPDDDKDTSNVEVEYRDGHQRGWFDGLLGCLRPVWTIIGKAAANEIKMQADDWEIAFESISDLQWLGSGAQGAVFLGKLNGEHVAMKKVREQKETDIRHLRKLNHPNIVSFKGVCTQAPCYCIVMEFCPYGPLNELLRRGREIAPAMLVDWAKQIANGMNYLHSHKIIHRDLKSPNVLIGNNEVIKISDFGTSREWNEISTKMSFAGTVAWMAPEVIRNEPCNEKVDIWSFGVVLWELLTCETPYKDVDSSAIIWGVGNDRLHLPVPSTCPDGFKLLMKQCWSAKPRNRPSFRHILMHLDIAAVEILSFPNETYFQTQATWRIEIKQHMQKMQTTSSHLPRVEEELVRRRREELRHAQDVREHYEKKLERANNLYMELSACMLHLEQREQEIRKREQQCQMHNTFKPTKKRIIRPIIKAQERLNKKRVYKSPEQTSPESPQKTSPVAAPSEPQGSPSYHPSSAKIRSRKPRHRRSGSYSGSGSYSHLAGSNSPRNSPSRERRVVDSETQTEHMDISETDTSPNLIGAQFHLPSPKTLAPPPTHKIPTPSPTQSCNEKNLNNVRNEADANSRSNCTIEDVQIHVEDQDTTDDTLSMTTVTPDVLDDTNMNITTNMIDELTDASNGNQQQTVLADVHRISNNEAQCKRTNSSDSRPVTKRIIVNPVASSSGYHRRRILDSDGENLGAASQDHDDSWSEEDADVDDSDDCILRNKRIIRNIVNVRSVHSNSTLSSEGNYSEEENPIERSGASTSSKHDMVCSIASDGFSDKEQVMQQVIAQARLPPLIDVVSTSPAGSSSDSEDVSDITVATTLPKTQSTETTVW